MRNYARRTAAFTADSVCHGWLAHQWFSAMPTRWSSKIDLSKFVGENQTANARFVESRRRRWHASSNTAISFA